MRTKLFKHKIHYAWFILIACCAIQGGTMGLIQNSCGVFYLPISKDLGISKSSIMLYSTIRGLVSTITLPLVPRVLKSRYMRILLSLFSLIYCASTFLMGFFTSVYQWYVASVFQGIASAFFTTVTCPLILSNWFDSKKGFALGFSAAFTGVIGIGSNYLAGVIIENFGWRFCYFAFGIVALIFLFPTSSFLLYYQPKDKNLSPYQVVDYKETKRNITSKNNPLNSKYVYMFYVIQIIAMFICGFTQQLASYGESLNMATTKASLLPTLSMAGNMIAKICLGSLSDLLDIVPVIVISFVLPLLGNIMLLSENNALFVGSFFVGIIISASSVVMPIFIKKFSRKEDFERNYTRVSLFGSITYSLSNTIYGLLFDLNNSYYLSIILNCILLLFNITFVFYIVKMSMQKQVSN